MLKSLTTLLLAFSSVSLSAADRSFDERRALRALDDFVTEYKVYATCSSLLPDTVPLVYESWRWQFQEAKGQMSRINPTKQFLARFVIAEATTLVDDSMSLGEARQLCDANKKALYRFQSFGYSNLSDALLEAR